MVDIEKDNKELILAIKNSFPEIYDKCISSAEDDIYFGLIDANMSDTQFVKHVIYETRNYINYIKKDRDYYKQALKDEEDATSDFISDVSIYFNYDEGSPTNFDELESCIEGSCEEFTKLKQKIEKIREYCREKSKVGIPTAVKILQIIKGEE